MPARALTVAVVVMGVLIVAGVAALAVGVARRAVHPTPQIEATPFAAAPIDLPKGAHVTAISTGTDRLVVAVALPGGSEELLVVDLATGRRLGTIPVHAAP
ncbi:MAG TPA: hypothetical protein VMF86_10140 [Stellaceae bacterium]|nr:hypothetical protein [Stellaceae bacterium]